MEQLDGLAFEQIPLLRGFSQDELPYLRSVLCERQVPAGAPVSVEGEPGDSFYMILEGQAKIVKAEGTAEERVLRVCGPGEFFGEMALLDPQGLRTASVSAVSDLRLLEMPRDSFQALMHERPALTYEMVRTLSLHLRDADNTTIAELRLKNHELQEAYSELQAAQAQMIEKERMEKELQTAHWIQQSILPVELPRLAGFDFGARMEPARAVGGDLFDFIPLGRGRMGVVIGDVSDKGVPAGIFMALARSLFRAEATRSAPPARVLQRANHLLLDMNQAAMFVTAIYGIVDAAQGTFAYARAGHELPLIISPEGKIAFAPKNTGSPLALFEKLQLDEQVVNMPGGSALVMYTDGASDMEDPAGVALGYERLEAEVQAAYRPGAAAQELCDRVWEALRAYQGTSQQSDDVALVAIRAV